MTAVRAAILVVMLLIAGIALLPLRLVADRLAGNGLAAQAVSGTIWRGQIDGASFAGIAIGDVITRARIWPPGLDVNGAQFSATLTTTGVDRLNGRFVPGDALPFAEINLENVSVAGASQGRACAIASGRVIVVPALLPQFGSLAGPLTCEAGQLKALLVPTAGDARVEIGIAADRRYVVSLIVGEVPALARLALLAAGFRDTPDGLTLTREGRL